VDHQLEELLDFRLEASGFARLSFCHIGIS
jgi:hypothetical protein